jgi:L-alanine-DL-glutamate epimerase-like enolase superfamily enzyme
VAKVRSVRFRPLDIELKEPFGIATGAQPLAANVLIEIELDDGTLGIGEAAPFPAVNGETQAQVLAALAPIERELHGLSVTNYRRIAARLRNSLAEVPSALAGCETALLDAFCRHASLSMWAFFGGAEAGLVTDITIPTGDAAAARVAAARARSAGFRTLKVKVGGTSLEHDLARLRAIADAAPNARLILDANASFDAEEALELLRHAGGLRERIALFEQPTAAEDWDGLRRVANEGRVLVAADESARSASEVARLAASNTVRVINIKIMKCGLFEAWDMIATARAHGLGLMVGGMVESELAMSASACLAAGVGGFAFVDLDTPLFMADRPLDGGFQQVGPELTVSSIERGHGVRFSAKGAKPATLSV